MYGGYLCAVLVGYMILVQCVKVLFIRSARLVAHTDCFTCGFDIVGLCQTLP